MEDKFEVVQYTDEQLGKKVNGIYNRCIKRGIDLCLAIPFFVILIPVYIAVSVAIIIEDGVPVLYRADRGGYKIKPFVSANFVLW